MFLFFIPDMGDASGQTWMKLYFTYNSETMAILWAEKV